MSSLKECVWDYDNISTSELPVIQHAERDLSSVIQAMVKKFPGIKIGGLSKVNKEYIYSFCTVFGYNCYFLNHDTGRGIYMIRNRNDKRIIRTLSYDYLCRNMFKPWKNDSNPVTPAHLAEHSAMYYNNIKHRLNMLQHQVCDATGKSLNALKSSVYNEIAYSISQRELYDVFSAAFGETIPLDKNSFSTSTAYTIAYTIFEQLKSYVELFNEYEANYMQGERLVISTTYPLSKPNFVMAKFKSLQELLTDDKLISVEYIRGEDHLKAIPEVMTRFAMLNAHSGENLLNSFIEGKYVGDKRFPLLNSVLLSYAEQQIMVFPGG